MFSPNMIIPAGILSLSPFLKASVIEVSLPDPPERDSGLTMKSCPIF